MFSYFIYFASFNGSVFTVFSFQSLIWKYRLAACVLTHPYPSKRGTSRQITGKVSDVRLVKRVTPTYP